MQVQFIEVPLAFLYLSAFLKAHLDDSVQVEMIDLRLERQPADALEKKLRLFAPDLIGVSLLSMDRAFLPRWCDFIKACAPSATIVIGGPFATYEFDAALKATPAVDCAVMGEGEITFFNLVTALQNGKDFYSINGIAYLSDYQAVCNAPEPYIEDLDTLPFPDYEILGNYRYCDFSHLPMNAVIAEKKYTLVISSRGCPYRCAYCHSMFGKKTRKRSTANFVAEIKWLYDVHGIREFHIADDIFNIDRKRMHEILHCIIDQGLNIKIAFPNGLRGDILTPEDLQLLKRAGIYTITFAVETASREIQQAIHKNLNIDRVMDNIAFSSNIGIINKGTFMLGFPDESLQSIKATMDLARKSKLDMAAFFAVMPFRNTELATMAKQMYPFFKDDDVLGGYWDSKSFYQRVTGYNLKRLQKLAYLKFYLPFRIFKTFLKLPSKRMVLIFWPMFAFYLLLPESLHKRFSRRHHDDAESRIYSKTQ